MTNPIKAVKRRIKYYRSDDRKYRDYWYSCAVDEHLLMIESGRGETVSGNMFALLKEVETSPDWAAYKPFFVVTNKTRAEAENKIRHYGFSRVKLVERMSDEYLRLLASCKYFFTDNTYPTIFCKKHDQLLVSTWHGTPLKHMGKAVLEGARGIGNVQRNFFMADYALFPNDFTRDVFLDDYLLRNQMKAETLMLDYPRNDVFFDEEMREKIRKEQNLDGKRVYAYMPTWRGGDANSVDADNQVETIAGYLKEIDEKLADDEILFVNLHPYVSSKLSYEGFERIRRFPAEYETYDFLNVSDALITDYSSVFFDYAHTKRSIVLFTYDLEDYMNSRGTYIDVRDLPFKKCRTVDELLAEVRKDSSKADKEFLDTYCKFREDGVSCSNKLLSIVTSGERREDCRQPEPEGEEKLVHIIATNDLSGGLSEEIKNAIVKHTSDGEHVTVVFDGGVKAEYIEALKEIDSYDNTDWCSLIGGLRDDDMPREVQRALPRWHVDTLEVKGNLRRNYDRFIRHLIPVSRYSLHDKGGSILISFTQKRVSYLKSARVGDYECSLNRSGDRYSIEIPKADLAGFMFRNRITLIDEFGMEHKIISRSRLPKLLKIIHTKVIKLKGSGGLGEGDDTDTSSASGAICYLQEYRARTDLLVRPANYTDKTWERIKIGVAYIVAAISKGKTSPILLYEKNSERYEESASVLYERLLDMGYDNVYYVIRRDCPAWDVVPDKYRAKLLAKYSFKHYLALFRCKTFIATERITHNIDLRPLSPFLRYWLKHAGYNYVFLQHGVMYMVSLDAERRVFFKLEERPGYKNRIVVSSELEAEHFIHRGGVEPEGLYVCGLLKFDKACRNDVHDRIVIMPTWRPGEANLAAENFRETSYYKFIEKIYRAVPDELKDRVVVLPHPLIKKSATEVSKKDDLMKLMVPELTHEEVLRMTDTLITDYSSISYDAFYRGANVIFDWEEKEQTIAYYGKSSRLMLTEDLAFGEVTYDAEALRAAISKVYGQPQAEKYVERFRKIVTYHDGRNTERFIEMAQKDGLL